MIKKIYKFLILLRGFDDYFYREVDVSSDCTLSELYYIILSSFDMISDKDFSNRKCKCCSTKCNFVNPKTKSFDNLPLKKIGIELGSRFQMVCNCNGSSFNVNAIFRVFNSIFSTQIIHFLYQTSPFIRREIRSE